jgi:hypothetical protein
MNATLCRTTEQELDICKVHAYESSYETAPMRVVLPLFQQPNEESLHTSFEEAISDRQIAVHERLQRLTLPLSGPLASYNTESIKGFGPLLVPQRQQVVPLRIQRSFRQTCLALMFSLVGFDIMGMLVLHIH